MPVPTRARSATPSAPTAATTPPSPSSMVPMASPSPRRDPCGCGWGPAWSCSAPPPPLLRRSSPGPAATPAWPPAAACALTLGTPARPVSTAAGPPTPPWAAPPRPLCCCCRKRVSAAGPSPASSWGRCWGCCCWRPLGTCSGAASAGLLLPPLSTSTEPNPAPPPARPRLQTVWTARRRSSTRP